MLASGPIETGDAPLPGVVQIRGTAAGFYLRRKQTRPKLRDQRSSDVGKLAAVMADAWHNVLSNGHRNQWNSYAATNQMTTHSGRDINANGWLWFNRINRTRITVARFWTSNQLHPRSFISRQPPPNGPNVQAPLESFDTTQWPFIQYKFDNTATWTTSQDHAAVVAWTMPASDAVNKRKNYGRIIAAWPGNPGTGYPTDIFTPTEQLTQAAGGTLFTYVAWTKNLLQ